MKQQLTSTPGRLPLDEDTFQQLLAAAYVLQEEAGRVRPKPPSRHHTQALSEVVATQSLLHSRPLDLSRRIDHNVRRAAGEPISPHPATESSFPSTSPAESIVPNLRAEIQATAPEAKSPPRHHRTSLRKVIVIALAFPLGWMVVHVGWQQAKGGAKDIVSPPNQAKPKDTGDPQVWVDFRKGLYYCSGDRHYGKTEDGQFTTLRYARISQYQPASPIPCQYVGEPIVAARENVNQPAVKTKVSSAQPAADSAATAVDGSQELLLAQHYLEGTTGSRDATEAAKWLWKAVGKQNPRALMMLSDLYLRGDGVPRSCDQARLLLKVAATKKGAPEAVEKLHRLELNGCPHERGR